MMKSRHNNIQQHNTTGFARRALLLLTFFVASVESVWGQTVIWDGNSGYVEVKKSHFETFTENYGSNTFMRVYVSGDGNLYVANNEWKQILNAENAQLGNDNGVSNVILLAGSDYFEENGSYYDFPMATAFLGYPGFLNNDLCMILQSKSDKVITKIEILNLAPDTFEDPNKSPSSTGTDITKYLTDEITQLSLDITKATDLLEENAVLTYARFYILHNGEPLDLSKNDGLLEITGVTPAKQSPKKGIYGYYFYNYGNDLDLSGISVKLNAEAGHFPEYQVICVLSTQKARTATGNEVTEEPYWDVMFTYAFRNQVETTQYKDGEVTWNAVAMTASVPAGNIAEEWQTTWANLAQEQKIQWYVTDGAGDQQLLEIGTERKNGVWTINLPEPFVIEDNIAVMTGQTTYDATSFEAMWNIWGNPAIYAPADKGYINLQNYKIVCKIADDADDAAVQNVIYTHSINKTSFAGQEKSTIVKTTQQVKIDTGSATSAEINFTLPTGTAYARFYIIDQRGAVVNEGVSLTIDGSNQTDKEDAPGWYVYNPSGLSLNKIQISGNNANLNEYQVIMMTSTETADLNQYEPDYDTRTTFWFKYPAQTWELNTEVDWSPQSMQITAPNIEGEEEGQKGTGYFDNNRQHYTLQWTVVDKNGNEQPLCIGDSRVDDYWSCNVLANPFILVNDNKVLTVSNDPNLNAFTWNNWVAPQFFAPANKTKLQMIGTKFVCKLYEDDEAGDEEMLSMIYTIEIKWSELGLLKDDGLYKEEIVGAEDIDHTQTDYTFSLDHATDAFREAFGKATYARVYLTKNDGTAINPIEDPEILHLKGAGTRFTIHPEYGYYFYDIENGVDLTNVEADLTLPAGMFTYYNVVVAMSTTTEDIDFNGNFYEPDFDYIYTFKFIETSTFPGKFVGSLPPYTKDVQIKAEDKDKPVLIPLFDEVATINNDLNANSFWELASSDFHVRWFVAKKNEDGTYEKLAGSESMLKANNENMQHKIRKNQGIYWNKKIVENFYTYNEDILKINFTKPTEGKWSDYQVIVWMTNDNSTATIYFDDETKTNLLSHEPDIKIQYIYSFVEESEPPFVHYQGEAYRYLKELGEDAAAQQRDYITLDGDAWLPEYTWNIDTESYEATPYNIRQSVHTWEYDIYVKPDEERKLILPFQWYDDSGHDGNHDEPRGYIRWYDWNTDTKVVDNNFTFTKVGNKLESNDRGLFALCLTTTEHPTHEKVGVTFTPNTAFTNPIDIACDVSKYSDGIMTIGQYENVKYYLLHEPTLSNRYIFHIRPASEIADSLAAAKQRLEEAVWKSAIDPTFLYDAMSTLKEDKGKVVVSIKDGDTEFALRFDHHNLHNYMLRDGDDYASATEVQWYAYIEKNGSISPPQLVSGVADDTKRIYTFTYSTFAGMGSGSIHVVGYAGKDGFSIENNTDVYAPVVHYELQFIEAPPVPLTNILSDLTDDKIKYKERMESYMSLHYEVKGVVDFDGNPETNEDIKKNPYEALYYYSTENWDSKPSTSADNMSYVPFPWDYNQYGFCYPQLTSTIKNGYGGIYTSPEHGDYIILKTMNVSPYSGNKDGDAPYEYQWWNDAELYDYTYNKTKNTDSPQYGSFLYTDASDESRSIATIPFAAELCSGSSFYFTAIVANMTDYADPGISGGNTRKISPQLLIRIVGIKDDGTRERIVAFHTGAFTKNVADLGKWYQVYGTSMVSRDFDTSITRFEAEVINYANGTLGADFAIDQIMIYTSTSKVLLTQTGDASCKPNVDEVEPDKVKAYMEADGLQGAFGISNELQPIYWRICDEDNGKVITGIGMYPRYDKEGNLTPDDGTFTYGVTWVKSNFSNSDLGLITEEHPYGWYYDSTTEKYFFQITDKSFDALEEGKHYYVSVFDPTAGFENIDDNHFWGGLFFGAKNRCSIYSEFFVPRRQYVTYTYGKNGTEGGELTITCGGTGAAVSDVQMILKVPDSNEPTGYKNYTNFHYDFAYVSLKTWKSADATFEYDGKEYKYADLNMALTDYRANSAYGDKYNSKIGLDSNYESDKPTYYNLLDCAIKAGILELAYSQTFNHEFTSVGSYTVTCIPIEKYIYPENSEPIEICAPFEVTFKLKSSGGPELELGFSDVTYPTTPTKYLRVVRVGLEQLENMQKNDYLLHIPVKTFKTDDDAQEKTGTLEIISPYLELLKYQSGENQTNDSQVTGTTNIYVATFEEKEISANKQYISINFNEAGVTPSDTYGNFKEGFTYRMFFQVKKKDAGDGACDAGVEFLMKVVPEFVTWNDGSVTGTNKNINKNWNNDENWSRSKREELHKGETNTGSEGHPNGYKDNGDLKIAPTPAAFVPMKFTYVTIPSNNVAPKLVDLKATDESKGIYTNINAVDGENDANNKATDNIEYDLMVRYTEEKCVTEGHKGYNTDTKIYDCEKFYGNWAKEIYFKPRAELVNQHYLTYEKVWVEKELEAGKWTLMSTPLQNTYAGDMYVPAADGQQKTEAFKDITFGAGYSRTLYPIYQRSWAQTGSTVYTYTNDMYRSNYSANLSSTVSETFTLWSHTYNDVMVDYSTWKGFAVRAHKSDYNGTRSANALLRLPKADNSYLYYDWNDNNEQQPTMPADKILSRSKYGKLFTDKDGAGEVTYGIVYGSHARTAEENAEVTVPVGEVQKVDGYLLVGNPYLCSIDMAQFLKGNKDILENEYWTYEGNTASSQLSNGQIKPLQSFFVKLKDDVTVENATNNIIFTSAMMVGNGGVLKVMPKPMMTMTAANDRGKSMATVSVGEEAKTVETLFDSNLNDVPMVYTVAEGQAVSINQLTELDKPIAFGVTCAASDDPVAVTFSDIAQLTTDDVFVVDAVTGEKALVNEGNSISVQPNDYGRYFLLAGTMGISDKTDVQKGIMVSVRGKVVTVTSGEALTLVRALSPDGTTVHQDAPNGMSQSFTLASGFYVIQAENAAGERQTVKVLIKTE